MPDSTTENNNGTIQNNKDFLFIYEASMCNPNGDPDQENKPRMDYETNTNLVTDTRLKRYIRDFLKGEEQDIFIDMEGDAKVAMDQKLKKVLFRLFSNEEDFNALIKKDPALEPLKDLRNKSQDNIEELVNKLVNKKTEYKTLNIALLTQLVKEKFIDIRMFGSAFAVDGFNKAFTGAIQMNWGYSLNKVELVDSNSIVTIMNDDSSTFGKDYRVYYSLLAFTGSINKNAAKSTGLTDDDVEKFRSAIWKSIPYQPTRSKINQYPKLYVEITYNEGYSNGHFGDLRNYIAIDYPNQDYKQVRKYEHMTVNYDKFVKLLNDNTGNEKENEKYKKPIASVEIITSSDVKFENSEAE